METPLQIKLKCEFCQKEFDYSDDIRECPEDHCALQVVDLGMTDFVLAEKYRFTGIAGVGGWSIVYKARYLLLDKIVAVKMLHRHLSLDRVKTKRFTHEARVLSRLNHPNIIRIYDHGLLPQPYLVMDYLEGRTLSEYLKEHGAMPWEQAVPIFEQLCSALQFAHNADLVHRDLKPSNIMLTETEPGVRSVTILDFGLVKNLESDSSNDLTGTGETVGSPVYMSPEQWDGRKVDERTDIYALGCVMYEALTATKCFDAEHPFAYMSKHLHETPVPFSVANVSVPPELEATVMKALAKRPEDRFQSMEQLAKVLSQVMQNRHASPAANIRRTAKLTKPLRFKHTRAVCVILCAVAVSGLIAFACWPAISNSLWSWLYDSGMNSFKASDYSAAVDMLGKASSVSKSFGALDSRNLLTLRKLHAAHKAAGNLSKADKLNDRILEITGANPTPRWRSVFRSAMVDKSTANLLSAEESLLDANDEARGIGPETILLAKGLNELAQIYLLEEKTDLAERAAKQALAINEKLSEPDSPETVGSLNELARIYRVQGKYKESEQLFNTALDMVKRSRGSEDKQIATLSNNLGSVYFSMGQFAKAADSYDSARKLIKKLEGRNSEAYSTYCNNLADAYMKLGQLDLAEHLLKESIAISTEIHGPNNPDTATPAYNLAILFTQQKRVREAEVSFKYALKLRGNSKYNHPQTVRILRDYSRFLSRQGREADSRLIMSRAYELAKKIEQAR